MGQDAGREGGSAACLLSTGSRLHSHGEIELPTKEPVVGFDNTRTDAIKPYPKLVQLQGGV